MPAADSIVPTIVAVSAALGGREAVQFFFARRKTSAEAEAAAAGAIVSKADAAQTLNETAVALVKPLTEQIAQLNRDRAADKAEHNREIGELRTEVDGLRRRARAAEDLVSRHAPWDRQMAERLRDLLELIADMLAGRTVSPARIRELEQPLDDPPPLYLAVTDEPRSESP